MEIIPAHSGLPAPRKRPALDYDYMVDLTTSSMAESSRRVYAGTYVRWADWCDEYDLDPLNALTAPTVEAFLIDQPVTVTTRERALAALRRLADTIKIFDRSEERQIMIELLARLRVPSKGAIANERLRVALTPDECRAAIDTWSGPRIRDIRNRALIAVLLLTGLRRSEIAVLRWSVIDLDNGVINVRHGKGDKQRDVAIYGEVGVEALCAWQVVQGQGREVVFCSVNKVDELGPDEPIAPRSVYRVVKETEERAGLAHFRPHDARRTLITELLNTGSPVHEVQEQAGHVRGETTLRYARAANARKRRQDGIVRYG